MPIPVATRTIHADIRNADGTPAAGSIEFIQRYWLYDETGNIVLAPGSYTGALENGEASVEVPATDAAGVTPTGRTVTVRIIAAAERAFYDIEVPSGSGDLELADLAPVASVGTPTTYATAAALTALDEAFEDHAAATTTVHGIADTADLVLDGDARLSNARTPTAHAASHASAGSDPVTPAAIGAYPASGGAVGGHVSLTEFNLTVQKAGGASALRFRTTGGAIDMDTVGDVTVTAWGGANFTGSETARQRWHPYGVTFAGRMAVSANVYGNDQYIEGGVAVLGGKNAGQTVTIAGRTATPGAPSAGTWEAGDAVLDPDGVWHLCSTGGTPGVWASAADVFAGRDMHLAAWDDVAMVIDQADDSATEADTSLWPDRVEYRYRGQRVQWANEFMEARCTPAHPANDGSGGSTVGWRMYAAPTETAHAARSAAVPVWEIANYRSGAAPNVPLLSLDHLGKLTGTAPAWVGLSLQAGTTTWNTAPASRLETLYRVVRCRGQLLNGTGGVITAGTTLAVVAAEHRPPANISTRLTRAAAVDDQRMFTINASTGALTSASGLGIGEAVVLDGLTWAL